MSSNEDKTVESGGQSESEREPPSSPEPPRRGGRVLGTLALLLALAALGLSGWLAYQAYLEPVDGQASSDRSWLEEQLQVLPALEQKVDSLAEQLVTLERRQQSQDDRADRIEDRLDSRVDQLGSLEQGLGRVDERTEGLVRRVDGLEQQLADRKGETADLSRRLEDAVQQLDARGDLQREVDRDLRQQMLMLEAAGLLRIGQDLAEVRGNSREAQRAFERARERLSAAENARLDPVMRTLAREIEALAAHDPLNLDAELARLERLGRASGNWPLQLPEAESAAETANEGDGWRDRLGRTFGALVRVESRDSLGRDEEQFEAAREQLRLRLVAAELALLRRDAATLAVQAEAAAGLLEEWFVVDAEPVAAAREQLQRLAGLDLSPDLPALGAALEQLQARLDES